MTHASSWAHMSTTWGTSLGLLGRLAYREKASGHGVVTVPGAQLGTRVKGGSIPAL